MMEFFKTGCLTLVAIFVCIGSLDGQAYSPSIQEITTDNGLGSSYVKKIKQDIYGFIWIWTAEGIYRYDGYSFQLKFSGAPYFFNYGRTYIMQADVNGYFWVGSGKKEVIDGTDGLSDFHLSVYDPGKDQLFPFDEYFRKNCPFQEKDILFIGQGLNGKIFINTRNGNHYCYDGRFREVFPKLKGHSLGRIMPSVDQRFWAIGHREIICFDSTGAIISQDKLPFVPSKLDVSEDGTAWIGTELLEAYSGLGTPYSYLYFKKTGRPLGTYNEDYQVDIKWYQWVFPGPEKKLWCYLGDQLQVYEYGKGLVADLSAPVLKKSRHPSLHFVTFDNTGQAWISARNRLFIAQLVPQFFQNYMTDENLSVRGIYNLEKGKLWVNTYSGSFILNTTTKQYRKVGAKTANFGYGAQKMPDGSVMIGVHSNYIARYDFAQDKFERIYLKTQGGQMGTLVEALIPYLDKTGNLWVGMSSGLARWDASQNSLIPYNRYNNYPQLASIGIKCFWENNQGIWMGTDDGLFLLHPSEGVVGHFDQLPSKVISCIYEDKEGIFWIGTKAGGLIQWNPDTKVSRQLTIADGLSNNSINGILEDNQGFLWMSSNNGLMRLDKKEFRVQIFTKKDGLPNNEFNHIAWCRQDNRLYFGGLEGVVGFDPKQLDQEAEHHGNMAITSLEELFAGQDEMVERPFSMNEELIISPRVRSFRVGFALMDFSQLGANTFAYKVEGLDKQWNPIKENFVRINGLSPGSYTLRVKGRNSKGIWSVHELSIPLFVRRPYYQTFWFWLLAGGALLFSVWGVFRLRVRRLEQSHRMLELEVDRRTEELKADRETIAAKNEELEKLNATKDKLFALIGHELRGPFIYYQKLIPNIQYLIEKGDYDRILALGKSLGEQSQKMSIMLDNLLNWGLAQTGRMPFRPTLFSLDELCEEILDSLDYWTREKQQELTTDIPRPCFVFADRQGIALVLRNLVINAIKFTPEGGKIRIRATKESNKVTLTVSDTGQGMEATQLSDLFTPQVQSTTGTLGEKGAGIGLMISREIIHVNHGKMSVESVHQKGTVFTIELPGSQSD